MYYSFYPFTCGKTYLDFFQFFPTVFLFFAMQGLQEQGAELELGLI